MNNMANEKKDKYSYDDGCKCGVNCNCGCSKRRNFYIPPILPIVFGIIIFILIFYSSSNLSNIFLIGWSFFWNLLGFIIFIFVIYWCISWFFSYSYHPVGGRRRHNFRSDEISILKRRYADGDISKKEFEEHIEVLKKYQ